MSLHSIWKRMAVIMLISALFIGNANCTSAALKYRTYTNVRFGYSIKYPSFYKQSKSLPENGDGITMSGKKSKLLMYGGYAVLYKNGKEMKRFINKNRNYKVFAMHATKKELYYEKDSKNGKKITFCYHYFKDDTIISMELTCKKGKRSYFAEIVNKMKKSIRKNISTNS